MNNLAGGAGADAINSGNSINSNVNSALSGNPLANTQNLVASNAGLGGNNPAALLNLIQGNPYLKSQNIPNGLFGILGQLGGSANVA